MGAATKEGAVSSKLAKRSGTALYSWRRATGLNRETFARIANFSERTLARYEKRRKLPVPVRPRINEAISLVRALMQIIPSEDLTKWLHTPNPGFDGKKPWTLIKNGERDLLWEMIHQTRHGAFA
jgi:transcriptional regulator with XRE-family HTH domain